MQNYEITDSRIAAYRRVATQVRPGEFMFVVREYMYRDRDSPGEFAYLPTSQVLLKNGEFVLREGICELCLLEKSSNHPEEFDPIVQQMLMAYKLAEMCQVGNIVVATFDEFAYVTSFRVLDWQENYPSACFGPRYQYLITGKLYKDKKGRICLPVRKTQYINWVWDTGDTSTLVFDIKEHDYNELEESIEVGKVVTASNDNYDVRDERSKEYIVKYFSVDPPIAQDKFVACYLTHEELNEQLYPPPHGDW